MATYSLLFKGSNGPFFIIIVIAENKDYIKSARFTVEAFGKFLSGFCLKNSLLSLIDQLEHKLIFPLKFCRLIFIKISYVFFFR